MGAKRVLHLVEYLYQGGVERLLEQIARHTPRERAELVIYAYQAPRLEGIGLELSRLGIPLYTSDKPPGYDLGLLRRLAGIVREHGITTVHTHDFGPMEYAVALKLRFPRLRLVHTHHTLHYFLRFPKYVAFFGVASLFYDRIACVSDHVRDVLSSKSRLARRKLFTLPNGIDVAGYARGAARPVPGKLRLVSVCRISPEKNLSHLLEAVAGLDADWELHHAGSGPADEEAKVRGLADSLGIAGRVRFHGFQSDVREVLRMGDVFVSTSLTEGHPVAVLEAMASGKLCVVSDIPPHRQISKEALVLFPLEEGALTEQLDAIAADPEAFDKYRQAGLREVAERFPITRMIEDYLALYA